MKGLLVAGAASSAGKTTIALAIMAAMRQRGHVVQSVAAVHAIRSAHLVSP